MTCLNLFSPWGLYSYSQTFTQESAAQESATQQVSALQQESATQHVSAFSHVVSLHFLLQHELMVRAATATITNNTFFIFFSVKISSYSEFRLQNYYKFLILCV